MTTIEELIAQLGGAQGQAHADIDPAAKVARIQERFSEMQQPNTFKVGDWVTPKADSAHDTAGQPCIVVWSREGHAYPIAKDEEDGVYAENGNAQCFYTNMVVLTMKVHPGTGEYALVPYNAVHFNYEYYKGPMT